VKYFEFHCQDEEHNLSVLKILEESEEKARMKLKELRPNYLVWWVREMMGVRG
jgi:hypothetical protein